MMVFGYRRDQVAFQKIFHLTLVHFAFTLVPKLFGDST
jgi:hypothetical protein